YLLCGRYPYGTKLAHCRTLAEQKKLKYQTALAPNRPIPNWFDSALKRALHVNPDKRFSSLSEFLFSLRYPNPSQHTAYEPLVKRHPLFVYKVLTLALIFSNLVTLILFN
ncbi:MAG: serine/threonine protein kinase, partial [Alteromonas macleodii]|nr:serine/threonine protein kinase [Alteromonas macleodii]